MDSASSTSKTPPPPLEGAVLPEREHRVDAHGAQLHVIEWGDPEAPPILCTHGMWDHAHCFDLLAPLLAERFRVVAFDARGHGDSSWADAYRWPDDVEDILVMLDWLGRPAHLVGHSKGGGQATDATMLAEGRVRQLVNLDGFGPPEEGFTPPGREPMPVHLGPAERMEQYLDRRRGMATRSDWRPYPDVEALIDRRSHQNPRLSREWLAYFSHFGARRDDDGWRWKSDPMAGWGFGPFRPDWIAPMWRHVKVPVLAVVGAEHDTWGPLPEPLLSDRLANFPDYERAVVPDSGHFMTIEQPRYVAGLILDFLEH